MSEWDSGGQDGHSAGSGPEHEPSEERGQAAWSAPEPDSPPPWASAQTRTASAPPPWAGPRPDDEAARAAADRRHSDRRGDTPPPPPPPWASAETQVGTPAPPFRTPPHMAPQMPPQPQAPHQPQQPQPWAPSFPAHPYTPPGTPRRGPGLVLLVLAVIVVAAGSALGVWFLNRDDGTGAGASPSTSVSAGASTPKTSLPSQTPESPQETPKETPSASTLASPPAAGYRTARDPVGYTLNVPDGWTRRQKQGEKAAVVFYDSPSDGRQLQIFELSESTPAESLDLAENDSTYGYSKQPGYQAGDRTSGDTWVELSYRYDDKDKGARQVIDHRFQAADGTLYAIRSSGPEELSADRIREPLAAAVASFCPTNSRCGQ
ncbi:hypothetical protein [Streptomyces sp. HUAS TT20]|uniref:hypothetical protein n=1 Tax=Streptomyces sp. HUAS TT20 TaxID=3447509 RepID=UPI0021D84432|nr:hypothetical protein [Streptomyces sp. HUAS 15-9]UXY29434.1 hypothetical protein N8I87_24655 [Streptomyces sp. HUAS 15-9]